MRYKGGSTVVTSRLKHAAVTHSDVSITMRNVDGEEMVLSDEEVERLIENIPEDWWDRMGKELKERQ